MLPNYQHGKKERNLFQFKYQGEEIRAYSEEMFKNTGYKNITEEEKHLLSRQELVVFNLAYMQHGALMWAPFALSDEETKILHASLKSLNKLIPVSLDLQKAEAQAREAQIELALERVRARTMAMQKSDELAETAYLFFQQFKELGQNPEQFTIGLINEKERNDGILAYGREAYYQESANQH